MEFYVTHFLVREGKARVGKKRRETLRIDAMDRTSSRWKGANILVFNTAHWWSHYKTKSGSVFFFGTESKKDIRRNTGMEDS